ncbi:uncharacterized protein LOC135211468 [Macrobrachium nipponense]|uniref:uncharacterized protein LOC135211468 n=1 Tax=Macrobrachium nipponense TaxID=159736 RepID=UPI0030C83963
MLPEQSTSSSPPTAFSLPALDASTIEYFHQPPNCLQSTTLGCFRKQSTSSSPPTAFSPPALDATRIEYFQQPPNCLQSTSLGCFQKQSTSSSPPTAFSPPTLDASRVEYFQQPPNCLQSTTLGCFQSRVLPAAPTVSSPPALDASTVQYFQQPPNCLQSTSLGCFQSRSSTWSFSPPALDASRVEYFPAAPQCCATSLGYFQSRRTSRSLQLPSITILCIQSRVLPAAPQLPSVRQPWMLPKQRSSSRPPTAFSPPALDVSRVEYFQQHPNCLQSTSLGYFQSRVLSAAPQLSRNSERVSQPLDCFQPAWMLQSQSTSSCPPTALQSTSLGCFQSRVLPVTPQLLSVHQPWMLPEQSPSSSPPTAFSPPPLDASRAEVEYFQQTPNCFQSTSLGCFQNRVLPAAPQLPSVHHPWMLPELKQSTSSSPPTAFSPPALDASKAEIFQQPPNCLQSTSLGCFQNQSTSSSPPTAFSPPPLIASGAEYFQQPPNCLHSTSLGCFPSRVLPAAPQLPSVHQPWMLPDPPTAFSPPALDDSRAEYFWQPPNCLQSTSLGCFQSRVLTGAPPLPSLHQSWMIPEQSTSGSPPTAISPPAMDASRSEVEYFQQPPTAFSPPSLYASRAEYFLQPPNCLSSPALHASTIEYFQQPPNCLQSTTLGCFQTEYFQQPPNCLQYTSLGCFQSRVLPVAPPTASTVSPPALDASRAEYFQQPPNCLQSTSLGCFQSRVFFPSFEII